MREVTIAGLVATTLIAVVLCFGVPTYAASRDIAVTVDHTLVSWQSLIANSPSNVSSVTVQATLMSNQDRNDRVEMWAYFRDANSALTPRHTTCATCQSLPSMNFMMSQDSGNWMPLTGTGPYGAPGGSLLLFQKTGLRGSQTLMFSESFNLNLIGVQSIAAGSYIGALFITARILSPLGVVRAESDPVGFLLLVNSQSSLTISVTPAAVYWDVAHHNSLIPRNANNLGVPGLTLTVSWQVTGNITTIPVYAFFAEPNTALTSIFGDATIPASSFLMRVNAGSYQPVLPGGGSVGYKFVEVAINDTNRSGTESYQLHFNINLASVPLPAGDYAGRLYLQAEAAL